MKITANSFFQPRVDFVVFTGVFMERVELVCLLMRKSLCTNTSICLHMVQDKQCQNDAKV